MTGPLLGRLESMRLPAWTPWAILALAMAGSAFAVLWVTRGEGFLGDEWGYYASYPGFELKEMLGPRVGHLQLTAILLYKGVGELFGPSDVAFRIILAGLVLLCGALVFELVRRRVGEWLALGPAILVLYFGSAGEAYASTLGIVITITIVFGLAMLLCLERGDLLGDVAALLLLCAALATYGPALAFLAGAAAVILFSGERPQWNRAWVFAAPLVLYLAWRLWSPPGQGDPAEVTLENLLHLPNSILDSAAAGLSAASGLFQIPASDAPGLIPLGWGQALLVLLVIGTVLLLRHRRDPVDRWVWAALAMPLVYWASIGAVSSAARPPEAARYQLLSAIFLILLYAQLASGIRLGPRTIAVVLAAFALAALPNVGAMGSHGDEFRANSDENRAELAALELVRDRVDPDFAIEEQGPTVSIPDLLIPASQYFEVADAQGSAAMSLERLQKSPEHVRQAADAELIRALEIAPRPAAGPAGSVGPAGAAGAAGELVPGAAAGVETRAEGGCLRVTPVQPGAAVELTLPLGGFSVRPDPGAPPELYLFRFGGPGETPLPAPVAARTQAVEIPTDSSSVPWRLHADAAAPLTLCPLAPA